MRLPLRVRLCWASYSLERGQESSPFLERFIVAGGETQEQAAKQFHALLAAELAYGMRHRDPEDPLSDIPIAPLSVFDAWNSATKEVPITLSQMTVKVHGVTETEVKIPAPELREAA